MGRAAIPGVPGWDLKDDLPLDQRFGASRADHSGQFRSTMMRRHLFWQKLLDEFGISSD
jgi:hypothetical protein